MIFPQELAREVMKNCCDLSKVFTHIDKTLIDDLVSHMRQKLNSKDLEFVDLREILRKIHCSKRGATKRGIQKGNFYLFIVLFEPF